MPVALLYAQPTELTQGIVFSRLQDSIVSENEWKIVLDFNFDEIQNELVPIKSLCKEVEYYLNTSVNIWSNDFDFEFNRAKLSINQLKLTC